MIPSTVLVSRSLNYDDLSRALKSDHNGFSADMAVGAPDARGSRGMVPNAWMPDPGSGSHWLELDYEKPVRAERLLLHETVGIPPGGEILLIGSSGTNVARIPISSTRGGTRPGTAREFSFPLTVEPVKTVRFNFGSTYGGSISVDAVGLVGPDSSGTVWASAARASSEASYSAGGVPHPAIGREPNLLLRAEVPVNEWSETWLSYTPFDGIALNAADLRSMPPAVQNAIWRYTEAGGNLFLLGNAQIPDSWRGASKTALEGGECLDAGFGRCFLFATDKVADLKPSAVKDMTDKIQSAARIWQMTPDEGSANSSFPVVENVKIPVRGIVFIMLAFVITIGPVNIFFLSRKNRRTWLLWTIPAISFVTSLVVFAYSMFREGVTSDVRIEGFTLLDQGARRATTHGITAFYCPLTPGGGLTFGSETEATPFIEVGDYRRGNSREVDWTQAQHLQRGWVTARVPAHFGLRKSETRRERIQLEPAGAQLSAVNGLGASVRSLWVADQAGRVFTATNIVAGQKAILLQSGDTPKVTQRLGFRALAEQVGFSQLAGFSATNAVAYLLPGTYIAELETNPFLENGLGVRAKSARTKSRSVVYGILETSSNP
jgi:hypothetical protein